MPGFPYLDFIIVLLLCGLVGFMRGERAGRGGGLYEYLRLVSITAPLLGGLYFGWMCLRLCHDNTVASIGFFLYSMVALALTFACAGWAEAKFGHGHPQ